MKYFELADIIRAILHSVLLGSVAGGIYNSLSLLISCFCRLLMIEPLVLRSRSIKQCSEYILHQNSPVSPIRRNVYDFLFFMICGTFYIFIGYLTLDGVHRIYVLIPAIVAFLISKNTVGAIFEKAIIILFGLIFRLLFCTLYVLNFPLKLFYRLTCRAISRPLRYLKGKVAKRTSDALMKKKRKEISDFFKSSPII